MLHLPSPALIGMVHLPPLPGSPAHMLDMEAIIERAVEDAHTLKQAGFHAVMLENYGDRPFYPDLIPPVAVACMAAVAAQVKRATGLRMGINALRNDAMAAISIAVAAGAAFVRVNVLTGVMGTDQGILLGHAAEVLRFRRSLGAVAGSIAILADVHVKHATPIHPMGIEEAARDTAYRGMADGLIVTGPATGKSIDLTDLQLVTRAVPDRRVLIGSGATAENIGEILPSASGVIVGSSLKQHGNPDLPVDAELAIAFVDAACRAGAVVQR